MRLRKIQANDLDGVYDLFAEVNGEGRFSAQTYAPPKDVIARSLAEAQRNDWPLYVVAKAGRIVGSAEAYPESFCRPGGDAGVAVLGLQVSADQRRRGLGQRLLKAVIAHCARSGFTVIELSVLKSNQPAIELYLKLGFKWVKDLGICELPNGVQDRSQLMRLAL